MANTDVHRFDTLAAAQQYVETVRRYRFDRLDSWGMDGNIHCYAGPNPGQRAAIRRDKGDCWQAVFYA